MEVGIEIFVHFEGHPPGLTLLPVGGHLLPPGEPPAATAGPAPCPSGVSSADSELGLFSSAPPLHQRGSASRQRAESLISPNKLHFMPLPMGMTN